MSASKWTCGTSDGERTGGKRGSWRTAGEEPLTVSMATRKQAERMMDTVTMTQSRQSASPRLHLGGLWLKKYSEASWRDVGRRASPRIHSCVPGGIRGEHAERSRSNDFVKRGLIHWVFAIERGGFTEPRRGGEIGQSARYCVREYTSSTNLNSETYVWADRGGATHVCIFTRASVVWTPPPTLHCSCFFSVSSCLVWGKKKDLKKIPTGDGFIESS